MTTIQMAFSRPAADGTLVPAQGTLVWTPTRSRVAAGAPDTVVLPLPVRVAALEVPFSIDVAPSGTDWVWKVEESFAGVRARRIYVAVPDAAAVDYTDLVQVDIRTLAPAAAPAPAWYAYVDGLAAGPRITVAAAAPDAPAEGDLWFDIS